MLNLHDNTYCSLCVQAVCTELPDTKIGLSEAMNSNHF